MNIVNKYQTLIIGLAVILGLLIGQMSEARNYAEYFIVPFLMIMLFGLFLNIPIKNLLKSFSNLKFFSANIGINFIWTPVFAYGFHGNGKRKYSFKCFCASTKLNFTGDSIAGLFAFVFRQDRNS